MRDIPNLKTMHAHVLAALLAITSTAAAADDGAPVTRPVDEKGRAAWYGMSSADFRKLPAAQGVVEVGRYDADLLRAAIFHESNVRRVAQKLRPLGHDPKVEAAAQMHASDMAAGNFFDHENPTDPTKATPGDRVVLVGLNPRFNAENIATAFAVEYESSKPVYPSRGGWSYQRGGKPLPPRTYLSFAKAVVDSWMDSPGHRANLLSHEPKFLGTGVATAPPTADEIFDTFYCAQVFFDPMPPGARKR